MSTSSLDSQLTESQPTVRRIVYYFLSLALSGYLLLWVAIFNGYAIFFPDSGEYLGVSFYWQPAIYRTISYSIFIRLVSFGTSPWLVIIAQSVIVIFVLHSVFKFILRENVPFEREGLLFLGLILFLTFGTTLPWFVGQIMPDVFTGLAMLSLFLLLYDSGMSVVRTALLSAVLCLSVATHITHLLTVAFLLLAIVVFRLFAAFRMFWPARSPKGIVAFVLVPVLAISGLLTLSNWSSGYGFSLSPARPIFLLGRLMESGMAADYLQQRCAVEEFTACKYLHNLPKSSEELLWRANPLFNEMGGWSGGRSEASRIVSGTIWHRPVRFAAECVKQMFRQFVAMGAGSGNYALRSGPEIEGFLELYPGDVRRYLATRQSIGKLAMDGYRWSFLYVAVFWCSFGVCLIVLFAKRLRARIADQLFVFTVIFLFANAFATGALSIVNDRYQARAAWLMGLCCAAYLLSWFGSSLINGYSLATPSKTLVGSALPRQTLGAVLRRGRQ